VTYVIAEPCVDRMDQSCVAVCPVDCIMADETDRKLHIDPDACIECGSCVSECAQGAIHAADELPPHWAPYVEIDAMWFRDPGRARAMLERLLTRVPG
jgi:NAD-dependent dihydropyrimidine dehydrogenase PreA subunit